MGHSIKLAEEFRENVERLGVVFGDSTETIVDGANRMAEAFGTSKIKYTALAQKLGGGLHAKGVGEEQAAGMTNNLMTLAQAIANFKHISIEEAVGKLQAGMAGRGRGLAEFGIGLNDAAIKNEALAMGLVKTGDKLTSSAKAQASFNIMMREGARVIDQMGERANDRKNAFAEFQGRLENIQELFGEKLPAPVESFFAQLNVALVAGQTAWTNWANEVITGQNDLTDFGQSGSQSIGMVQRAVGLLADAWQLVAAGFHSWQANFNGSLAMIVESLVTLDKWIENNMPAVLGGGKKGENRDFLEGFAASLHDTASKQFEDLRKEWAKPWASEGIAASFDATRKKLHEARAAVVQKAKESFKPGDTPETTEKTEAKGKPFVAAMEMGSKEAASTMFRTAFGIGSDAQMAKVADNTKETNEILGDIRDKLSESGMVDDGVEMWTGF